VVNSGHVFVKGTSVPDSQKEQKASCVYECHSRKATPEEMEKYFGDKPKALSKDDLMKRLHPAKEPTIDDCIAAAQGFDERKYRALKAAVMAIGLANDWE
jgi:hypothetical protein